MLFYSVASMSKRLSHLPVQLVWTLPLNLAYGYQWRMTTRVGEQEKG
jgi:hypothetical protein